MKRTTRAARRIMALALGATMVLGAVAPTTALAGYGSSGSAHAGGSSSRYIDDKYDHFSSSRSGGTWSNNSSTRRTYVVYVRYQNYNRSYGAYKRYTSGTTTNGKGSFRYAGTSVYQTTTSSFNVTKNNQAVYVSIPRKNVSGSHWVIPYVRYQNKNGSWSAYKRYAEGFQAKHNVLGTYTVYSYYSTSMYGPDRKIAVGSASYRATRDNQIVYVSVKYSKYSAGMGWSSPAGGWK